MVPAAPDSDRPLTPKGRATRDRIAEVAAALVLRDGLSALNMDAVRKAASVSGSQLSHYFADKRALIHAVIARQIQVVLDFHRQPKLGALDTFDDFERWIDLNMRYLRRIGYSGTPTFHALAGQLGKSDTATRRTLASGYWQWIDLLEKGIQRMKERGVLVADADPRRLALVIVSAHQGGGTLTFTYQAKWPHADAVRFAVNYLRMFAADPDDRIPRPPPRPNRPPSAVKGIDGSVEVDGLMSDDSPSRFTRKGRATRERIVGAAARLMFRQGVGDTSIEEVRRTAAVSGSQISHYFRDKRDLTREVIAARRADVRNFHTPPRLGALNTLDALQAWADTTVAKINPVYRKGGCVFGSLAGELTEADNEVHQDLAGGYDEWIELFRAGLAEMRDRGVLRADADPRHLAVSLVAAHQGGALITFITNDAEPLRAALNGAVEYVRSFAPSPGGGTKRPRRRRQTQV